MPSLGFTRINIWDTGCQSSSSSSSSSSASPEESPLAKITKDSAKITVEQVHGLMSQVIKDILFNSVRQSKSQPESSGPEPMIQS
nr:COP9 signalosome complex subunit 5a-like [Tanacetum cinerariifolium]